MVAEVGGHVYVLDAFRCAEALHGEWQVLRDGHGRGTQTHDVLVEGPGLRGADTNVHAGHGDEDDDIAFEGSQIGLAEVVFDETVIGGERCL